MKSGFYNIPLTGLKEGSHIYDFEINDDFFCSFEESEIKDGRINAEVTLIKRSAHMELNLRLAGSVSVSCDRCLENYLQGIDAENHIFVNVDIFTNNGFAVVMKNGPGKGKRYKDRYGPCCFRIL